MIQTNELLFYEYIESNVFYNYISLIFYHFDIFQILQQNKILFLKIIEEIKINCHLIYRFDKRLIIYRKIRINIKIKIYILIALTYKIVINSK